MATLPTSILGRTGIEVTKLGYGAMEVRGTRIWGGRPVTDDEADRILNAVLDSGITFIDTANDYGRSEEYIGRFLAKRGPGMHHVAYEVDDIRAALAELADAGAELIDATPRRGMFGLEVAFVHPDSVHGVLSEVVSIV